MGIKKDVVLGDTNSLPYSTRITGLAQVTIFRRTKRIMFSAFPSINTARLAERILPLYPDTVPVTNVLETMLNNGNAVSHTAPVILNAGRIEYSKGEFYIYQEGVTPSVGNVLDAVDRERLSILKALGLPQTSFLDRMEKSGLAPSARSIREAINSYPRIKGPANVVSDRYIVEDVPYGLVPMASLARMIDVETPVMDSLTILASSLTRRDFWNEGRTVDKMGISGLSLSELADYVEKGTN
jgi:opine dehydrogenase